MPDDENSNSNIVIKDLAEDYNFKVATLLDEIEHSKRMVLVDQRYVIELNYLLHSLFIKLSPKLTTDEMELQYRYRKAVNKLTPLRTKKIEDRTSGHLVTVYYPTKHYNKYRAFLEVREMHLNKILERTGLTARDKAKGSIH